jgi:hypothetical protein
VTHQWRAPILARKCDIVQGKNKRSRFGGYDRVGVCVMCGCDFISKRSHTKTCSPKCRKALSRKDTLVHTKPKKGLIRINGVAYEAETGRMFTEVN